MGEAEAKARKEAERKAKEEAEAKAKEEAHKAALAESPAELTSADKVLSADSTASTAVPVSACEVEEAVTVSQGEPAVGVASPAPVLKATAKCMTGRKEPGLTLQLPTGSL